MDVRRDDEKEPNDSLVGETVKSREMQMEIAAAQVGRGAIITECRKRL